METELKFQVPAAQRAALRRAVATPGAQRTLLQAVYADTPDRRLAAAGLALRLRKEGRRWVQALKGSAEGAGALTQRLEHEVPVAAPGRAAEPAIDPARHAGTPVGDRLLALLADAAPLEPVYRTHIRRTHRVARHGRARIELAYDEGFITAGDRRLAVCELELELQQGAPAELVTLAARWVARFGLWWDLRTKSERGFRLAAGDAPKPAVTATLPSLDGLSGVAQALPAGLAAALRQALVNANEIAGGSGSAEHVHQLRVGLRRLRSLLRLLAPWAADPAAALQLQADWRAPFGVLGASRDDDVLLGHWLPQLQAAGAPPMALPAADAARPDVGELLRSTAFNTLLLRSLALVLAQPAVRAQQAEPPHALLRPLARKARRDAAAFEQASVEQRHRLRKRLKRLRYTLELLQPLLAKKATARALTCIKRCLLLLGELNDLAAAEARLRGVAGTDAGCWFAIGWLRARHDALLPRAARRVAALRKLRIEAR
jgi:triphosphatase